MGGPPVHKKEIHELRVCRLEKVLFNAKIVTIFTIILPLMNLII